MGRLTITVVVSSIKPMGAKGVAFYYSDFC